eukprot:gnl/TRDRNA2_/TRDRNA2_76700_c0_seq1.p1 gnl/TRDRNA2_/TRDRNA2_76700_c0~~gnl/TRDRNA2_/TRDRNA2_76700_c0_seq1.p1  ORF type:complete len:406 (-),score=85.34 gnl/TRDRNA2_/TRDRNA2_76700_c0_seq1:69-1286(-)
MQLGGTVPASRPVEPIASLESMPSCSNPELVAPEVWRHEVGPKCDIWAIGCLMFLLLTGKQPFGPGLSLKELAHTITCGEPDWRLFRNVSTSALSLCRRMLAKHDALRPSAAECLRHPWLASPQSGFVEDVRLPRELPPHTLSMLMQFHAQSKLHQVLMNLVASELKVSQLRHVSEIFAKLDSECTGILSSEKLATGLQAMGISAQSTEEVMTAIVPQDADRVPYTLFVAGSVDLVDDKLDHMLWKVFTMVDEEHRGEISTVELEHFLEAALEVPPLQQPDASGGTAAGALAGDAERYLRSLLNIEVMPVEDVVAKISRGRPSVAFEDMKLFLLDCTGTEPTELSEVENASPVSMVLQKTRSLQQTPSTRRSQTGAPTPKQSLNFHLDEADGSTGSASLGLCIDE